VQYLSTPSLGITSLFSNGRATGGRRSDLSTPSLGITEDREGDGGIRVGYAFNSLSRDHMARLRSSHSLPRPSFSFNSLSRDHDELPRLHLSVPITFNSLSRDHKDVDRPRKDPLWLRPLSTPSLGITSSSARSAVAAGLKGAFNSLSRDHRLHSEVMKLAYKLSFNSLSRDHKVSQKRCQASASVSAFNSLSRDHKVRSRRSTASSRSFQLPLSGSP